MGPGGYYHFPDYVADLAELVDALAPRRLAVVGHSMGGTVAALYAGTYPERVERLALLEGMGPVATEPRVAVDRMHAWLRTMREVARVPKPLSSLQEAIERLALHHPRVPRDVIESRARLLTRADDTGRLVWAYDPLHRTTAPTPFNGETLQGVPPPHRVPDPDRERRLHGLAPAGRGGPRGLPLARAPRRAAPRGAHDALDRARPRSAQRLAAFFGEAPAQ